MNVKKVVFILVIVTLLLILWNRKGKDVVSRIRYGSQGDNENKPISEARQLVLEGFAEDIYKSVYDWWDSNENQNKVFMKIVHLPDNEFKYVVNYYNDFMGDNSMFVDVDWEFNDYEGDDLILARIERMNLKK